MADYAKHHIRRGARHIQPGELIEGLTEAARKRLLDMNAIETDTESVADNELPAITTGGEGADKVPGAGEDDEAHAEGDEIPGEDADQQSQDQQNEETDEDTEPVDLDPLGDIVDSDGDADEAQAPAGNPKGGNRKKKSGGAV